MHKREEFPRINVAYEAIKAQNGEVYAGLVEYLAQMAVALSVIEEHGDANKEAINCLSDLTRSLIPKMARMFPHIDRAQFAKDMQAMSLGAVEDFMGN